MNAPLTKSETQRHRGHGARAGPLRTSREQVVVVTTDDKGRLVARELDRDLAEDALEKHYARRVS